MSGLLNAHPLASTLDPKVPPPPLLVARLTHLIQSHAPSSRTTLFLASLLHSLLLPFSHAADPAGPSSQQSSPVPADEQDHTGRLLYAKALLASGAPHSALHLLEKVVVMTGEPELVEVAQKACAEMGRWREGAWLGDSGRKACWAERGPSSPSPIRLTGAMPSASERSASQHLLQATLHHKGSEPKKAEEHYRSALQLDPLCWDAFEGLCDLGAPFVPADLFLPLSTPLPTSSHTQVTLPVGADLPTSSSSTTFAIGSLSLAEGHEVPASATGTDPLEGLGMPPASKRPRGISGAGAAELKGKPRLRGVAQVTAYTPVEERKSQAPDSSSVLRSTRQSTHLNGASKAPVERRSKTLPKRRALSKPPSSAASDASFQDQVMSPPPSSVHMSRTGTPVQSHFSVDAPSQAELLEVDNWIVGVMRIWGRATLMLSKYRCKEAIAEMDLLPKEVIRGSVEACLLVGKCWFEMVDYVKAKRAFTQARSLDPYRLKSMDIFSTLLWHLHDDVALSHLSQDLLAISRTAPESWIALGNCFSLQKEHDEAMRCFRRASQLDPRYAYAHTLSGHEAVSMEEYDRALAFFQTAVRIEKRHFNAWYGLGTAYLRKNKFRHAEHSFRRAVEINQENAVLLCCVGQVLERRGKKDEALHVYEQAYIVNPDSPMVGFRRAKALASVGRIEIALPTLQQLVLKAPNEFNIHFLLGKIYTLLRDPANATRSFAYALDIDPKMSGAIKAAQTAHLTEDEDDDGQDDESQMTEGPGL